jgi:hypothetical protein
MARKPILEAVAAAHALMQAGDVPGPFRATRLGRASDRQAKTIGLLAEAADKCRS